MVNRIRRNLLIGVHAALALRPFAAAAQAPLRIEITEGVIEPMPFAAPGFVPDSQAAADLAGRITQVVVDDLTGTGLFREIPQSAHIGRISNFDAPVAFADWRAINAQALITGAVGANGDRAQVRFRLWDVFAQQGLG
jgi:TolB protein